MKHLQHILLGVFVVVALALSACTMRIGDLTVVATQNVNLDKVDLDKLPQTKGIRGEDSAFIFLFIPFGFPNLKEAIDDAMRKGNGDVMVDAVIYRTTFWFLIGVDSIEVKGNVIKTRNN
jgi:hypothetical protein